MKPIYHILNGRTYTAFDGLTSELDIDVTKNYLFDIDYLSILSVQGDKAQEFLQGQLSCDLNKVNQQTMQQGAMCNLKGRVLALMDVIKGSENDVLLILPEDLLTDTQASLAKPAMFSKVTLHKNTDYECFGFYAEQPDDITPFNISLNNTAHTVVYHEDFCCYSLGQHFYMLLVKTNRAQALRETFFQRSQYRGSLAWHALRLQQMHMEIYPGSRGLFLPHRLNLQNTGYLSFDKGCYKGQEIIARTHYRATLKHELRVVTISSDNALVSGQSLVEDDSERVIGELIDFCPTAKNTYLILVSILIGETTKYRLVTT